MSRPKFPNCIMTPGMIRSIRQDQEAYDRDPEGYEQQEREAKERHEQEQEEIRHWEWLQLTKEQ